MTIDPIERLADSRDGLDRVAQRFERAQARRTATDGRDSSGQVTVRTDPDGDVTDVIIGTNWQSLLDPEQLGAAVVAAYNDAGLTAAKQWGLELADALDEPEPATRPLPGVSDSVVGRLDALVTPEQLAERSDASMSAMIELLEQVVGDVDRVSADAAALAARTITGEAQGARVTVSGTGHLITVELDPDWTSGTSASSVSRFVMTAHRQARREARARTVEDLVADSSIGELERLSRDPRALAERLRLL